MSDINLPAQPDNTPELRPTGAPGRDEQIAALNLCIDTLVELSDALRAENEQLRAAIGSPEVCAGVVSEVVELQRDIAVKNCGLLREQLAAAQSKANNTQQKGSTDD